MVLEKLKAVGEAGGAVWGVREIGFEGVGGEGGKAGMAHPSALV